MAGIAVSGAFYNSIERPAIWVLNSDGTVQGNRCNGTFRDEAAFTSEEGRSVAISDDSVILVTDTQGVEKLDNGSYLVLGTVSGAASRSS